MDIEKRTRRRRVFAGAAAALVAVIALCACGDDKSDRTERGSRRAADSLICSVGPDQAEREAACERVGRTVP